ncbi:MAG: hypothetical protein ACTS3F_05390 [Phycisphaerales bacterium]
MSERAVGFVWYRKALARRRAEVVLARQRLRPGGGAPDACIGGASNGAPTDGRSERGPGGGLPPLPRLTKRDLVTLSAGAFAAAMVLGPSRALRLAERGVGLAAALLPPSDGAGAGDAGTGTGEQSSQERARESAAREAAHRARAEALNGRVPAARAVDS